MGLASTQEQSRLRCRRRRLPQPSSLFVVDRVVLDGGARRYSVPQSDRTIQGRLEPDPPDGLPHQIRHASSGSLRRFSERLQVFLWQIDLRLNHVCQSMPTSAIRQSDRCPLLPTRHSRCRCGLWADRCPSSLAWLQAPSTPQTTRTGCSASCQNVAPGWAQSFSSDLLDEVARLQERRRERPTGPFRVRSLGRRPTETRFDDPETTDQAPEGGGGPWRPLSGIVCSRSTRSSKVQHMATSRPRRATALKEAMTKKQLVASLSESTGLPKRDVSAVLDELGILIERHIKKLAVGTFTLPGLLRIARVRKPPRKARTMISLRTGEEIKWPRSRPRWRSRSGLWRASSGWLWRDNLHEIRAAIRMRFLAATAR